MSNETEHEKKRVKSLANSDVKKTLVNRKWRRLCSVNNCQKQSQRKGLCARHIKENSNRQKSTKNITPSDPSSTHSTTIQFDDIDCTNAHVITLLDGKFIQLYKFDISKGISA